MLLLFLPFGLGGPDIITGVNTAQESGQPSSFSRTLGHDVAAQFFPGTSSLFFLSTASFVSITVLQKKTTATKSLSPET